MVAKPLCPLYKNIIKHLDRARYPELRYNIVYSVPKTIDIMLHFCLIRTQPSIIRLYMRESDGRAVEGFYPLYFLVKVYVFICHHIYLNYIFQPKSTAFSYISNAFLASLNDNGLFSRIQNPT